MKRKSFRRPKVNCLCRCTPRGGIIFLTSDHVSTCYYGALKRIGQSQSTSVIADVAVRTGRMLDQTGHTLKAIQLYKSAIQQIVDIDESRAMDYYDNGPLPSNPHYRYWRERVSMADALEVAKRLDMLLSREGITDDAHQQQRVHKAYDHLFRLLYEP